MNARVEVDQDKRPAVEQTDLRDDGTFEGDGNGAKLDASQGQAGNSHRWTFSHMENEDATINS
jgi:hypothetical protein